MSTLVIATHNIGKLKEFAQLFTDFSIRVRPISDFSHEDVAETGLTFVENALLKARYACQCSGLSAIADDSGLVVDALEGKPGVYSARYAGELSNATANNQKLLQSLEGLTHEQRTAHFVCCLVYLRHVNDPSPLICQATWHGHILSTLQGTQGFGYDPLFYLEQYQCTAAQLSPYQKNKISHRGKALRALVSQMSSTIN